MLLIKHPTKNQEIRSSIEEFTIGEFEYLSSVINDSSRNHIDKWTEIFKFCGMDEEILDDMDSFDFIKLIGEFNVFEVKRTEIEKSIVLDDIFYFSYDEEFKISVKEMKIIEGFIKDSQDKYIGDIMAVLYKRPDVDKNITFDPSHIKYKAKLIRSQVNASVCVPIINYISKKLIKEVNILDESN